MNIFRIKPPAGEVAEDRRTAPRRPPGAPALTGTRVGTRAGTRVGTRTGTRVGTRTGTRVATRTGTRAATRTGTRVATRTGSVIGTHLGTVIGAGCEFLSATSAEAANPLRDLPPRHPGACAAGILSLPLYEPSAYTRPIAVPVWGSPAAPMGCGCLQLASPGQAGAERPAVEATVGTRRREPVR